jgi:hypothetical protein
VPFCNKILRLHRNFSLDTENIFETKHNSRNVLFLPERHHGAGVSVAVDISHCDEEIPCLKNSENCFYIIPSVHPNLI